MDNTRVLYRGSKLQYTGISHFILFIIDFVEGVCLNVGRNTKIEYINSKEVLLKVYFCAIRFFLETCSSSFHQHLHLCGCSLYDCHVCCMFTVRWSWIGIDHCISVLIELFSSYFFYSKSIVYSLVFERRDSLLSLQNRSILFHLCPTAVLGHTYIIVCHARSHVWDY